MKNISIKQSIFIKYEASHYAIGEAQLKKNLVEIERKRDNRLNKFIDNCLLFFILT